MGMVNHRFHMGIEQFMIPVSIWGSPYGNGDWSVPRFHMGITVTIWGFDTNGSPLPYGDPDMGTFNRNRNCKTNNTDHGQRGISRIQESHPPKLHNPTSATQQSQTQPGRESNSNIQMHRHEVMVQISGGSVKLGRWDLWLVLPRSWIFLNKFWNFVQKI